MVKFYDTPAKAKAALQRAAEIIFETFEWDTTPEGDDYWGNVRAKLYAMAERMAVDGVRSKSPPGELRITDDIGAILLEAQGFKLAAKPRQSARSSVGQTAASPAASAPKAKPPSKAPKRKAAARGGRTLGQAMLLAHAASLKPGPKTT